MKENKIEQNLANLEHNTCSKQNEKRCRLKKKNGY